MKPLSLQISEKKTRKFSDLAELSVNLHMRHFPVEGDVRGMAKIERCEFIFLRHQLVIMWNAVNKYWENLIGEQDQNKPLIDKCNSILLNIDAKINDIGPLSLDTNEFHIIAKALSVFEQYVLFSEPKKRLKNLLDFFLRGKELDLTERQEQKENPA